MKKICFFLLLTVLIIPYFAFAEEVGGETDTPSTSDEITITELDKKAAATAAYVKGAFDAVTNFGANNKNTFVTTDDRGRAKAYSISETGTGNVVTDISVNDGQVAISKSNVTIPVGSASETTNYATVWIE